MRNLHPTFEAFPRQHDAMALLAWQRGRTGYCRERALAGYAKIRNRSMTSV
jgi:hypothetical protein